MESNSGGETIRGSVTHRPSLTRLPRTKCGVLALSFVLLLGACSKPANETTAAKPKSYILTGEIVSADTARKVLVVRHD